MSNQSYPTLLTTMPKAGTYFLAEILSEIGLKNRHFHVARNHCENLIAKDNETVRFQPSQLKIPLKLNQILYTVHPGEFVFGHIPKTILEQEFLDRYRIIYSFKDKKDALQAEFYWFREIRQDMAEKFAQYNHLSAEEHFIKYLEQFGDSRIRLFRLLDKWAEDESVVKIDFDKLRADRNYAIDKIQEIGNFVGKEMDKDRANEILEVCFKKPSKTKTNRDKSVNLWTPEAEALYEKLLKRQTLYSMFTKAYRPYRLTKEAFKWMFRSLLKPVA